MSKTERGQVQEAEKEAWTNITERFNDLTPKLFVSNTPSDVTWGEFSA